MVLKQVKKKQLCVFVIEAVSSFKTCLVLLYVVYNRQVLFFNLLIIEQLQLGLRIFDATFTF